MQLVAPNKVIFFIIDYTLSNNYVILLQNSVVLKSHMSTVLAIELCIILELFYIFWWFQIKLFTAQNWRSKK